MDFGRECPSLSKLIECLLTRRDAACIAVNKGYSYCFQHSLFLVSSTTLSRRSHLVRYSFTKQNNIENYLRCHQFVCRNKRVSLICALIS